jgi:hypothetical protein
MFFRFCLASLFILFCRANATAQHEVLTVKDKLAQLRSQGIDSILYYDEKILGPFIGDYVDSMICDLPGYLVWASEGNTFVQKFQGCHTEDYSKYSMYASPVQT